MSTSSNQKGGNTKRHTYSEKKDVRNELQFIIDEILSVLSTKDDDKTVSGNKHIEDALKTLSTDELEQSGLLDINKYIEERSPGFNTFSIVPELKELFSYYEKNTITCDKNKSNKN